MRTAPRLTTDELMATTRYDTDIELERLDRGSARGSSA
jgi:hypothetical protein